MRRLCRTAFTFRKVPAWTERVAGGAQGIGGLLGMPALPALPAGGAGASVDVELRDDRYDGRQVRLIVDDLVELVQRHMTQRALIQGNVDDTVDLLWDGCGPKIRGVPLAASGLLGFVASFGPTKGMGLAMGVALRLVELLAEALEFLFQFSDAAIALLTAGTSGTRRSHDAFLKIR
jgi:hypothetical protein